MYQTIRHFWKLKLNLLFWAPMCADSWDVSAPKAVTKDFRRMRNSQLSSARRLIFVCCLFSVQDVNFTPKTIRQQELLLDKNQINSKIKFVLSKIVTLVESFLLLWFVELWFCWKSWKLNHICCPPSRSLYLIAMLGSLSPVQVWESSWNRNRFSFIS